MTTDLRGSFVSGKKLDCVLVVEHWSCLIEVFFPKKFFQPNAHWVWTWIYVIWSLVFIYIYIYILTLYVLNYVYNFLRIDLKAVVSHTFLD